LVLKIVMAALVARFGAEAASTMPTTEACDQMIKHKFESQVASSLLVSLVGTKAVECP